jgi:predicted transcriptional regulator of viral defense system
MTAATSGLMDRFRYSYRYSYSICESMPRRTRSPSPSPSPSPGPGPSPNALAAFHRAGGTLRASEAIRAGIHPRMLYLLRDAGRVECISRGVYRLAGSRASGDPDLVAVSLRIPRGVICLTSALAIHGLTTHIPHSVDVALPPGGWTPVIRHPPTRLYRFSPASMSEGVEEHVVDGTRIRVFSAAKSVADSFKFRNKIGLDIALEALRAYLSRRRRDLVALARYAEVDRVDSVMRPYIDGMLA